MIRMEQRIRIAVLLSVFLAARGVAVSGIAPRSVISGVMSYMSESKYGFPICLVACPDGTYWLAGFRREATIEMGMYQVVRVNFELRRLGSHGERLGADIILDDPRFHGLEETHDFLGTDRHGNLLIYYGVSSAMHLAKVGAGGILWVQESVPYVFPPGWILDADDKVWLLSGDDSCTVIDAASDIRANRTVVRYAEYLASQPTPPAFLHIRSGIAGFLGEHKGRQIVACVPPDEPNTLLLYKLDRSPLALIDSGRVNMTSDAWGGTDALSIPGTYRVEAAAGGGYWVYRSRYNQLPPPAVLAFRVDSHLRPITDGAPGTLHIEPISSLPSSARPDVVLRLQDDLESFDGHDLIQQVHLTLDFIGFGTDGKLYLERVEDSLQIHISEQR